MKVLEYNATVVSNIDEVSRDFEEAFLNFICAIEALLKIYIKEITNV